MPTPAICAPFLVSPDGRLRKLHTSGMPVGMIEGAPFQMVQTQLAPGDKVVIYSDGLTEAEDAEGAVFRYRAPAPVPARQCQARRRRHAHGAARRGRPFHRRRRDARRHHRSGARISYRRDPLYRRARRLLAKPFRWAAAQRSATSGRGMDAHAAVSIPPDHGLESAAPRTDLVRFSERDYARFSRDFERAATEEILRHDPHDTVVLATMFPKDRISRAAARTIASSPSITWTWSPMSPRSMSGAWSGRKPLCAGIAACAGLCLRYRRLVWEKQEASVRIRAG